MTGVRHIIRVHEESDTGAALMDRFWEVVENGARDIWVDVSAVPALGSRGRDTLERMSVFAHELDRDLVVVTHERAELSAIR